MSKSIERIGVLTSGGDAPGMNACLRAVVRTALYYKKRVFGIKQGYSGLIAGEIEEMHARSVSNIIPKGGTILKSARSDEFRTKEGREKAFEHFKANELDALVVIGGDGTFGGAHVFHEEFGVPVIGCPGTIDNDLYGTDYTIGFDTACNTAIEAIDKIRDTASSHNRLFFVEVMGRDAGFIAVRSAISGGAEAIMIPERDMSIEQLVGVLEGGAHSKTSSLVIVAEGGINGGALEIAEKVKEKFSYYDAKVTVLGHLQRGGSPTCLDRILASQMGVAAVEGLLNGEKDVMVGVINKEVVYTPLEKATKQEQDIEEELLRISNILAI